MNREFLACIERCRRAKKALVDATKVRLPAGKLCMLLPDLKKVQVIAHRTDPDFVGVASNCWECTTPSASSSSPA